MEIRQVIPGDGWHATVQEPAKPGQPEGSGARLSMPLVAWLHGVEQVTPMQKRAGVVGLIVNPEDGTLTIPVTDLGDRFLGYTKET